MKKLLAILVIVMLAVPMFAGTDILNFMWFNNKIGLSFSDDWNIKSAETAGTVNNANESQWNYYGFLEQFMCGMWGTAYDGDPVKIKMDFFNYFSCEFGDWGRNNTLTLNEQIRFKGIIEVGSMYTLAIGGKGAIRLFPLEGKGNTDTAGNGLVSMGFINTSLLLENTIKIPNILNISLNGEFQWVSWGGTAYNNSGWTNIFNGDGNGQQTDFNIYIDAAIGNSYAFGFSWNLSETIIIGLDLQNVAGNRPTKDNTSGTANTLVTRASYSQGAQPNYFTDVPLFKTQLDLSQNILSLAGVKDVSLVASVSEQLQMMLPYTGNQWELTKLFQTEGVYGLTVGFYGFTIGAFFTLATEDSYNTSVPMQGYAGSTANADGSFIQGYGSRNPGRGQVGIMLKWGYSRGFFGFEMMYHGQAQVRDYDMNKDNFNTDCNKDAGIFVDHGGLFRTADTYHQWTNNLFISINFSW